MAIDTGSSVVTRTVMRGGSPYSSMAQITASPVDQHHFLSAASLRVGVSLVRGEPKEAVGLALVLRQATAAVSVEGSEIHLRLRVSLIRGELKQARGLALVLRQTSATPLVQDSEIDLPVRVPLFRGEPKEAGGFAIVLRQSTAACQIADSKIVLPACVPLVRGELEEAGSLAIVLRQAAKTHRIEKPKTDLRSRVSLVCGELVKARGLAIVHVNLPKRNEKCVSTLRGLAPYALLGSLSPNLGASNLSAKLDQGRATGERPAVLVPDRSIWALSSPAY
jgi:hypothetical protein